MQTLMPWKEGEEKGEPRRRLDCDEVVSAGEECARDQGEKGIEDARPSHCRSDADAAAMASDIPTRVRRKRKSRPRLPRCASVKYFPGSCQSSILDPRAFHVILYQISI